MTQPGLLRPSWTSVNVFQRLVEQLKLQTYPIDPSQSLWLPPHLQPTLEVSQLLKTPAIARYVNLGVSGNGNLETIKVPAGYRYWLHAISTDRTSGDFSVTPKLKNGTSGYYIQLNDGAADGDTLTWFGTPYPMDPGDAIYVTIGSYVGAGQVDVYIAIQTEYAYALSG